MSDDLPPYERMAEPLTLPGNEPRLVVVVPPGTPWPKIGKLGRYLMQAEGQSGVYVYDSKERLAEVQKTWTAKAKDPKVKFDPVLWKWNESHELAIGMLMLDGWWSVRCTQMRADSQCPQPREMERWR